MGARDDAVVVQTHARNRGARPLHRRLQPKALTVPDWLKKKPSRPAPSDNGGAKNCGGVSRDAAKAAKCPCPRIPRPDRTGNIAQDVARSGRQPPRVRVECEHTAAVGEHTHGRTRLPIPHW